MVAENAGEFWKQKYLEREKEVDIESIAQSVKRNSQSLRHPIFSHISQVYPDLSKIHICEIGAGWGSSSLALALRGAKVTLLDVSDVALNQAGSLAAELGLSVDCLQEDIFNLSPELEGQFDIALSAGLIEHFQGGLRKEAIINHTRLVRSGGIIGIGVPNAVCPFYRLWKFIAERKDWWSVGFEKPYTRRELRSLCRGLPLSRVLIRGTDFSYAANRFFLDKLYWGLRNILVHGSLAGGGDAFRIPSWLRIPEIGWPFSEYWGYSLVLIATKSE